MIEANKYKLGIFVVIGVILFMIVLFFLGLRDIFQPKVKFGTLFNESVRGLEVGTAVKFRGVSVGKVSKITLRPEDNYVWVEMEALLSSIDPAKESDGETNSEKARKFYNYFSKEIEKGLRCRLEMSSIATGMKFVELDYFDPGKNPPIAAEIPHGILYIPSTASLLSGISTSLSDALAKIASVDYSSISTEVVQTFKSVNNLLNNPKIEALINKMEKVSTHLETITSNFDNAMTEDRIKGIAEQLDTTMKSVQDLSRTLRTEVETAGLPTLAANANNTLKEANKVSDSVVEMRKNMNVTLDKLDQAIDSFTELVKYLEEDPSSIMRGKQKPKN